MTQKENFLYNVARVLINTDYWEHNDCVVDDDGNTILLKYSSNVNSYGEDISIINYIKSRAYTISTENVIKILHYNPIEVTYCDTILFISNKDLIQSRQLAEQYKMEL